jgi:hypothetical protein
MMIRHIKYLVICALLFVCDKPSRKDLAENPFLQTYVQQLKKTTSDTELRKITTMAESELALLHDGYGMGIRNQWIRGKRDPALVQFFLDKKINEPDEMSMVIIEALWLDLNKSLTPADRESIQKKRATVARKRATYKKLESECETQLTKAKPEFEKCYASHGLPSENPELFDPFYGLIVDKSGRVKKIEFFNGASPELKVKLTKILNGFTFSKFDDDEFITLYILTFPDCGVAEWDKLHNR